MNLDDKVVELSGICGDFYMRFWTEVYFYVFHALMQVNTGQTQKKTVLSCTAGV